METVRQPRILVLGASGMLGGAIARTFNVLPEYRWDSEHDITSPDITHRIVNLKPDMVINCAAYTDVDGCETNQLCFKVNGQALQYIASACKDLDIPLVHYSTDYIFNGEQKEGYREDDVPDPINEYGAAKRLGEEFLESIKPKYYLIRTAWLYGQGGKNFVNTISSLAETKKEIAVVDDQFGAPTWTEDLASHTKKLLEQGPAFGVYHFEADGLTSWFDVAREIVRLTGSDCVIVPQPSSALRRAAQRPHYSKLLNTKFEPMRDWQSMLKEYLSI